MRNLYFLAAIASIGIFVLCSCGSNAGTTNNTTAQNTAAKANTAAPKTDAPTSTIMKPGDVSPDKAVKIIDLIDSVAAGNDGWKGKEVAVTGYVSGTSGSGKQLLLTMTNDQTATNKKNISCALAGGKADDVFSKTIEVKGKIINISTDGEVKMVSLDPCELKK